MHNNLNKLGPQSINDAYSPLYESKLSNFYRFAKQLELNLNKYHLDDEDKWDESRLSRVDEVFTNYKKKLPEMLLKCSSAFAIQTWDNRDEYPDFLGECYNHIAEDTIEAIVNSDKVQFTKDFENLTKIMLVELLNLKMEKYYQTLIQLKKKK